MASGKDLRMVLGHRSVAKCFNEKVAVPEELTSPERVRV